jgi:ADP-ribose pyrophosphatase YjhB (NUDIX family)
MPWMTIAAHCPRCGAPRADRAIPLRCPACGLVLFCNAAVGVGAFIADPVGRVLFTVRAKDPGKGMLGLPGGFVDAGESAEDALRREAREEIGGTLGAIRYLCSSPNRYLYAGVDYDVLDVFFAAELAPGELQTDADEIAGMRWLHPAEVDPAQIAFPSMRAAWQVYLGMSNA